jgi:hypothetical protein
MWHGFSNCGTHATTCASTISYAALIKTQNIKKDKKLE